MSKKKITIEYEEHNYESITDYKLKELIDATMTFAQNAYAPYSNFKVSAGLRLENGKMLMGSNVENASYPVSICAERTLLGHAVSNYPNERIIEVVVFVDKNFNDPVPPCGLCRQTLIEVEARQKQPIKLHMVAKNGKIISVSTCSDLLPWSFDGSFLD